MKKNFLLVTAATLLVFSLSAQTVHKLKKKKHPCPSVTVDSTTYEVWPCSILMTIDNHRGDTSYDFTIVPSAAGSYGFSVYGYGVGMPTYGMIAETSSGRAWGNQSIHVVVKAAYAKPDGSKPKVYAGYLPVHIYHGSETGRDSNFIKLPFEITVNP